MNNGANGTGSTVLALDGTITTPGSGTAGALFVDLNDDIDGDGFPDANVIGVTPNPGGVQPLAPDFTGPNRFIGTFIRIGKPTPRPITFPPPGTTPDVLLVDPSPYLTSQGPLDANYTDGTVHSLRVTEAFVNVFQGPAASTTPVAIANIVVPTGTSWSMSFIISGNLGAAEQLTVSNPEPASFSMLVLAGAGLAARRRLR